MAYMSDTLEPAHGLTELGEQAYRQMLEFKADEILFRAKHPFKYWTQRLRNLMAYGDSSWDGSHYSLEEKYKDGFAYSK